MTGQRRLPSPSPKKTNPTPVNPPTLEGSVARRGCSFRTQQDAAPPPPHQPTRSPPTPPPHKRNPRPGRKKEKKTDVGREPASGSTHEQPHPNTRRVWAPSRPSTAGAP